MAISFKKRDKRNWTETLMDYASMVFTSTLGVVSFVFAVLLLFPFSIMGAILSVMYAATGIMMFCWTAMIVQEHRSSNYKLITTAG